MPDPTAAIEAHVHAKQIAFGRSLAGRKKIYLDLNFWTTVRNVALGVCTATAAIELLDFLRRAVSSGRFVCPVSDSMFLELIKQPLSADRRIGTARLVDELSLGVAIIPSRLRIGTEIYRLFHEVLGQPESLWPTEELVWTKVCHILRPSYPVNEAIDPEVQLMLQKRVVDTLWETALSDMILRIGNHGPGLDHYAPLTAETNRQRDAWAHEITSFQRAYDIELRGGIDAYGDLAGEVMTAIAGKAGLGTANPQHEALLAKLARNTLYFAFKTRNGAATVRTLHVEVVLHASLRVDKRRPYKPNDFYDFQHAAAALSYCDAFLTEGLLHDLIKRPQLNLLAINGCEVASTIDAAVTLLRTLVD